MWDVGSERWMAPSMGGVLVMHFRIPDACGMVSSQENFREYHFKSWLFYYGALEQFKQFLFSRVKKGQ